MGELVAGGVALVLALVFGLLERRARRRGDQALAELEDAREALKHAEAEARALARPLDGRGALDVLDRVRNH